MSVHVRIWALAELMCVSMHVCVSGCVSVSIYTNTHIQLFVCMYVCVCARARAQLCVCAQAPACADACTRVWCLHGWHEGEETLIEMEGANILGPGRWRRMSLLFLKVCALSSGNPLTTRIPPMCGCARLPVILLMSGVALRGKGLGVMQLDGERGGSCRQRERGGKAGRQVTVASLKVWLKYQGISVLFTQL